MVVFDGAMGTQLQSLNLSVEDYHDEGYFGCHEYLSVTRPDVLKGVHSAYLEAGCDVIETNTFGASSIVLSEYGLAKEAYSINLKAARIARSVADDFSKKGQLKFVAGSLGPTTKLPSLGHISFKPLAESYQIQTSGLIDGGADLLCVETSQDVLQIKAALYGIHRSFEEKKKRLPIIVSVTIESTGTMLLGTEISAALTTIEPFGIQAFGINCATGPREMSEHIRILTAGSPIPVFVMPNAGIPENVGGKVHYGLSPEELVKSMKHFVSDLGVQVVGGCCGTSPDHIKLLAQEVGSLTPSRRSVRFQPSASSLYGSVPFKIDRPPVLVGERTNANGSKLFRDLLQQNDFEGIVAMGKEQVREQVHLQDVCVAYVGRKEIDDMSEVMSRFNRQITSPLLIDSTDHVVIEEALRNIGGRPIVNSINLEDGEEKAGAVLKLCKSYGAAVIALTIDEEGMAKTAERKLQVAHRIHTLATKTYGIRSEDIIFDPLTFTLASGDEEYRKSAIETLEAIRRIKKELPNVHTLLGVSNISFGFDPKLRKMLNSVFLHEAVEAGLDLAIVHASKIIPLFKIDEKTRDICRKLIYDERVFEGEKKKEQVVFDPLAEFLSLSVEGAPEKKNSEGYEKLSIEERLKQKIIDGTKSGLHADLEKGLEKYTAIEIINTFLLDGMKKVGELFGSGQMQLPFVLQSAEVMKESVSFLEKFMEKKSGKSKGTIVLATVKGDVHDIGKNLVDIILTNNGFNVINLGIKCSVERMIQAFAEHDADAIGMSGLLVKSTVVMKENLEVMKERNITKPTILGGAALTRRYVEEELRLVYDGEVHYARDAFDGLRFMEELKSTPPKSRESIPSGSEPVEIKDGPPTKKNDLMGKVESARPSKPHVIVQSKRRYSLSQDHNIPSPPFWGTRIVDQIELEEVYPFINDVALLKGQWRFVKGKLNEAEYQRVMREEAIPDFERLKRESRGGGLLTPKVVYGYFPCVSQGNELIIYDPESAGNPKGGERELLRFDFPRQENEPYNCIADFFSGYESGKKDVLALQLVTVGAKASEYAMQLFESNNYKEYLYFHGFSVEFAEALAEYWHKQIRVELSIDRKDAKEIEKLWKQGYQGSRYSLGYPACPNLEDQAKIFTLLRPERIGVTLTEEFQLEPEQSTSAFIVHHPEARYFTLK